MVTIKFSFIVTKSNMEMMLRITVSAGAPGLVRRTSCYELFSRISKVRDSCEIIVVLCMDVKYE